MEELVCAVLQVKIVPPAAVSVVASPAQTIEFPLMEAIGCERTFTIKVELLLQPETGSVTVNE